MRLIILGLLFNLYVSNFLFGQTDLNLGLGVFEGEPYLVVNPSNPDNIVVAWMHITPSIRTIRTKASFDGGQSWGSAVDVPKIYSQCADPTMAFNNAGDLFLCYINHSGGATDTGGVFSLKSSDGGLSWTNLTLAIDIFADGSHQPVDRPWLVCDRSTGVNQGNLYLTTKNVSGTPAPYRPYFLKSTDDAQTWSNWRYVDSTGWLSGVPSAMAVPSVDVNGVFHGIYVSYVASQNPLPRYIMASSNDAGSSFTYNQVLANLPSVSNDSAKLAWQMSTDPSDANHMVLCTPLGINGDLDIFMTETSDGGMSWSPFLRVNDDPIGNGVLQDLVWSSFDTDGDLVVCWRDRRNSSGSGYAKGSEIMGSVLWKDSLDFEPNFIISDEIATYNNILAEAGNDFLSQQVSNDTLYIAWGDTRTGFLNIWFDRIDLQTGNSVGLTQLAHDELPLAQVFPNPATDQVDLIIDTQEDVVVTVFNDKGEKVEMLKSSTFSIQNWAPGVYFLRVQSGSKNEILRLVKK